MSMDNMITQGQQGQVQHSLPSWQEQSSWNSSLLPPILSAIKKLPGNLTSCLKHFWAKWMYWEITLHTNLSALPSDTVIRKQSKTLNHLFYKVLTLKRIWDCAVFEGPQEDLRGLGRADGVLGPCNLQFMSEGTKAHGAGGICLRSHTD